MYHFLLPLNGMECSAKILIIEDEPGILTFLQEGLEEEGHLIITENNGKKGLSIARSQRFDLILLDWMLPEISGLEICQEIRKQNITTPILFLTAKDTVEDTIIALKSGANDYIQKPFSFEELLARIDVQLRGLTSENKLLRWNNITLNPQTHEVLQDQNEIYLTPKEFDLLLYLVQHKNTVCERKKIIEDVWDIHFDYDTSILDVYMNAIRKKINITKDNYTLQTIRGIGFMAREHEI